MIVLVIDDDTAMTDLVKLLLRPAFPEVVAVNSGTEGLRLIRENDPDAVILDLMMPDLDGREICLAARQTSDVPILILSALDTPGMVADALNAGADDYLIKPVTQNMLITHVTKLLQKKRSRRAN